MKSRAFVLATLLFSIACGNGRQLQSVSISPAMADAKDFPNGIINFVATGTFNQPPSPQTLTSNDVYWCVGASGTCDGLIYAPITLTQDGVVQCRPGSTGQVTVLAGKVLPGGIPDGIRHMTVFGSAQITCP